jgi:hypothetical protein
VDNICCLRCQTCVVARDPVEGPDATMQGANTLNSVDNTVAYKPGKMRPVEAMLLADTDPQSGTMATGEKAAGTGSRCTVSALAGNQCLHGTGCTTVQPGHSLHSSTESLVQW